MKTLVAVLSESPLYFTMTLRDRHGLLKRLASRAQGLEQELDLNHYASKVTEYLKIKNG